MKNIFASFALFFGLLGIGGTLSLAKAEDCAHRMEQSSESYDELRKGYEHLFPELSSSSRTHDQEQAHQQTEHAHAIADRTANVNLSDNDQTDSGPGNNGAAYREQPDATTHYSSNISPAIDATNAAYERFLQCGADIGRGLWSTQVGYERFIKGRKCALQLEHTAKRYPKYSSDAVRMIEKFLQVSNSSLDCFTKLLDARKLK